MTEVPAPAGSLEPWPSLPLDAWRDTYATLHRWTQVVGKIRLARMPWINRSWHVALYVTARELTTSPMPCGTRTVQIDVDFIDHRLIIQADDGAVRSGELRPRSVADFYQAVMGALQELGLPVHIDPYPTSRGSYRLRKRSCAHGVRRRVCAAAVAHPAADAAH